MNFDVFHNRLSKIEKIELPGQEAQFKMVPPFRQELVAQQKNNVQNAKKAGVMALFYPDVNAVTTLVLILRKTYKGVHSAQVGFPGGKLEEGESPTQALKREFLEETALEILNSQELMLVEHDYPDRQVRLHVHTTNSFNGKVAELEGQTLRWVEVDELDGLDFLAGNHVILDKIKGLD